MNIIRMKTDLAKNALSLKFEGFPNGAEVYVPGSDQALPCERWRQHEIDVWFRIGAIGRGSAEGYYSKTKGVCTTWGWGRKGA